MNECSRQVRHNETTFILHLQARLATEVTQYHDFFKNQCHFLFKTGYDFLRR